MQLHAQAQAGQQASLASLVSAPPGLPGLPPGAGLGLPPGLQGLQGLPPGLNIPTSLSSSLLQGLPTSIAASLGGLVGPGANPLHPALSMLKPQLPPGVDHKREDEIRKSLSESNGRCHHHDVYLVLCGATIKYDVGDQVISTLMLS